jgi:AraC family transcriptional activator of pobA
MQGATMADHAEKLGVTPTHLARASKSATGQTAADHITARLFFKAQSALLDGNQTSKAIAEALNFGSPAYFTRFIQQHSGFTPSQLRLRK